MWWIRKKILWNLLINSCLFSSTWNRKTRTAAGFSSLSIKKIWNTPTKIQKTNCFWNTSNDLLIKMSNTRKYITHLLPFWITPSMTSSAKSYRGYCLALLTWTKYWIKPPVCLRYIKYSSMISTPNSISLIMMISPSRHSNMSYAQRWSTSITTSCRYIRKPEMHQSPKTLFKISVKTDARSGWSSGKRITRICTS